MGYDRYRVSVQALENGFMVEVPDAEAIAKKKADAKKMKQSEPYLGDCTKSFAAKNIAEVVKLVRQALESIPDSEYNDAFEKAASGK